MIVTLEDAKAQVEVVDKITWGMQEEIRSAMLGGIRVQGLNEVERQNLELDPAVLSKAKYKALELCIKKVIVDGKDQPYTKEWMDSLSIEDGDKVFNAVNEVTNPKKK